MTKAITVIAHGAGQSEGTVMDVLVGVELATGLVIEETVAWEKLPLGLGGEIIGFMKSKFFTGTEGKTYGTIAREYLEYRMSKLIS